MKKLFDVVRTLIGIGLIVLIIWNLVRDRGEVEGKIITAGNSDQTVETESEKKKEKEEPKQVEQEPEIEYVSSLEYGSTYNAYTDNITFQFTCSYQTPSYTFNIKDGGRITKESLSGSFIIAEANIENLGTREIELDHLGDGYYFNIDGNIYEGYTMYFVENDTKYIHTSIQPKQTLKVLFVADVPNNVLENAQSINLRFFDADLEIKI